MKGWTAAVFGGIAGFVMGARFYPNGGTLGLVFFTVAGAAMGLHLLDSERWVQRFGMRGWYMLWALAGASSFAATGGLLALTGSAGDLFGGTLANAFTGLVLGIIAAFGFREIGRDYLHDSEQRNDGQ